LMTQHHENQQDEDYDAEAALQQTENDELEEGVFRSMIDSIGWIVKIQKAAFFPIFQTHLLPFIAPLLEQKTVPMLRGQAICMIDDIIEHCGDAAQELVPLFLNHLVQGLEDPSPSVIQASAYGIGVSAEKCGAAFDPFCQNALEKLVHLITISANVDDDEVGAARDNAISAVAKICLSREGAVDAAKMWPMWLSWLPLRTDVLEARDVHARLISLVDSGNPHVLGAEYGNLALILKVFATALCTFVSGPFDAALMVRGMFASDSLCPCVVADVVVFDLSEAEETGEDDEDMTLLSDEAKTQLRELLAKLQTQLPGPVVQGAWATLSAEEQHGLSQL
ncbi:hypothetical protein BBJ28_00024773, partial [Nothophytophthora sp. Chile5]